jgi:hypothetical protein
MAEKEQWNGEDRRRCDRDEELVRAVVCAIREESIPGGITPEMHREQHAFISEWMEEMRIKRERREKIKTQVFGWAIVSALGSVGTAAYHGAMWLREHLK